MPKTASSANLEQIFMKRTGWFYNHFKARAEKQFTSLPFTLGQFRDWLGQKLEHGGVARCEYSGEVLDIGNLAIDHRFPVSRAGNFDLCNLAICSKQQNLRKGNMTEVEYGQFKAHVERYAPEVQESIWKRMEIGDVQRFSHFRRQKKASGGLH